jgi:hypothetical protein
MNERRASAVGRSFRGTAARRVLTLRRPLLRRAAAGLCPSNGLTAPLPLSAQKISCFAIEAPRKLTPCTSRS